MLSFQENKVHLGLLLSKAFLQGSLLQREGLRAAAVTLYSATALPNTPASCQALHLAKFVLPEEKAAKLQTHYVQGIFQTLPDCLTLS